jgi:hypothetical protein
MGWLVGARAVGWRRAEDVGGGEMGSVRQARLMVLVDLDESATVA